MQSNILVVEDEPAVRLAIAKTLESRNYSVETCETGEEAIQRLSRHLVKLVILDVNLPDRTGWDVVRHIRQELRQDTPIIMISAVTPRVARLREYGIAGVLQKPFPMESLFRLVARHTGQDPTPLADTAMWDVERPPARPGQGSDHRIQRGWDANERAFPGRIRQGLNPSTSGGQHGERSPDDGRGKRV